MCRLRNVSFRSVTLPKGAQGFRVLLIVGTQPLDEIGQRWIHAGECSAEVLLCSVFFKVAGEVQRFFQCGSGCDRTKATDLGERITQVQYIDTNCQIQAFSRKTKSKIDESLMFPISPGHIRAEIAGAGVVAEYRCKPLVMLRHDPLDECECRSQF